MRILGLDWGEAKIGVSVSDPLGISALPIPYIGNDKDSIDKIKGLIGQYDINEIVIGLPKMMSGKLGIAAIKVKDFHEKLKKDLDPDIKVLLWDERLTTKMAQRSLMDAGFGRKKMKGSIDSSSASMMLQSYMDSKRHG